MSTDVKVERNIAWFSLIPQLSLMIGFIIIYGWSGFQLEYAVMYGAATYLAISFTLRITLTNDHRKGMKLIGSKDFAKAIDSFEKSYSFFKKHAWLDKYRYFISSGKMQFKEMALINIAYCNLHTGNITTAKKYYLKTLQEFPENTIAKTTLAEINNYEMQQNSTP